MSENVFVLSNDGSDRDCEFATLLDCGQPAMVVDFLGVHAWAVAEPNLAKALMTDRRISKNPRNWPLFPRDIIGKWPLMAWPIMKSMSTADGVAHRRLRDLVAPTFGAHRIAEFLPRIEECTATLLDALATFPPDESVDLIERYVIPLPAQIIGDLLGLPEQLRPHFQRLANAPFDTMLSLEQQVDNVHQFHKLLHDLIAIKRAEPDNDLTSLLVTAHDHGSHDITERELIGVLTNVIVPGHVIIVGLVGNAIAALLNDRSQLAHIYEGRATWNDVIDETLRLEGPVTHVPMRYALEDIYVTDELTIRKGDAILIPFSLVGRHPTLHGDTSNRFDVTRPNKEHLAFGHGPHYCLGAALARAEATVALPALFDRFPQLHLAIPTDTLRRKPSLVVNSYLNIPVHSGQHDAHDHSVALHRENTLSCRALGRVDGTAAGSAWPYAID